MTTEQYIFLIIASFLGAGGSGFFNYVQNNNGAPFSILTFAGTLWSALLSAALAAAVYKSNADISFLNYIIAFIGGAGVNVLNSQAQGISQKARLAMRLKQARLEGEAVGAEINKQIESVTFDVRYK